MAVFQLLVLNHASMEILKTLVHTVVHRMMIFTSTCIRKKENMLFDDRV